jgi:hypothetical protein
MSDECIELDRADSGIVARSSAIIGKSEHDTSEDAVRKSLSLFWGLNDPHKFWAKIGVGRSTSGYAKNSEVFVQGADADSIFYLREGRAKVTVTSNQGKETTVGFLEVGQFFGDGCLSGHNHQITTTKTLTNCRITAIDKTTI